MNAKDHVYVHPSFLFLSQLFCSKWNSETLFFCVPVSMDRKAECNCKECDECLGLGNLDTPPKRKFGHPKNQHAYQATERYFAKNCWKLTFDDNVIDDALKYHAALMVRDKLRAAIGKKAFQQQPERFAEGQRRVAAMTRKLDAYQKNNMHTRPRRNISGGNTRFLWRPDFNRSEDPSHFCSSFFSLMLLMAISIPQFRIPPCSHLRHKFNVDPIGHKSQSFNAFTSCVCVCVFGLLVYYLLRTVYVCL